MQLSRSVNLKQTIMHRLNLRSFLCSVRVDTRKFIDHGNSRLKSPVDHQVLNYEQAEQDEDK